MNEKEAGFTLTEVLLTIAIVLVTASVLTVAVSTALKNASLSFNTAKSAVTITRIDRFIRTSADDIIIPYWAPSSPYIEIFISNLYLSDIGSFINSVTVIYDHNKKARGIEVNYTVNNNKMRTVALFSSIPVMEGLQ